MSLRNAVNLHVEEGYTFSPLALAMSILLFPESSRARPVLWSVLLTLSLAGVYLSKSSMSGAVVFITAIYCWQQRKRSPGIAMAVVGSIVLVGFAWSGYVLHSTGRVSIGTSADFVNLHMGNNEGFSEHYPPPSDGALDQYNAELNNGRYFENEWALSDYHKAGAIDFIHHHPVDVIRGGLRKAFYFYLSPTKIGDIASEGVMGRLGTIGLLLFRILLVVATARALVSLVKGPEGARLPAIIYLGFLATVGAPYIAGFALTRHASVLVFPSALFLGREIAFSEDSDSVRRARNWY
jgi:hypothetical protein